MGDIHDLTAIEQAAAIRAREVSPTELVEHYLARIERHGDVGAFVTVTADRARAEAAEASTVARANAFPGALLGPGPGPGSGPGGGPGGLEGVPVGVKDLTLTAGVRTTFGSVAFADFVPPIDADVVTFMREAGLIMLGKTTTSEFGLSLYSETTVAPPARNPWDARYTAGGSSGGSAAAVAAGLVPFAQGNDGGGSLRIPASICGIVGYKPSRGLVSGGPLGFGGFGLPTNGPLARTVADAAALLDILSAPALGEPYPSPARPLSGFLDAARHPEEQLPKGRPLRVGRYLDPLLADVTPSADVRSVWEQASLALAALGAEIIDVEPPFPEPAAVDFESLWRVMALSPVPPGREAELLPLTRWLREGGRAVRPEQLVAALADIQVRVRRHARTANGYDVLLSPVLTRSQAEVGWFSAAPTPAEDFQRQASFSPYCAAYNLTGQPAVSLPLGTDASGNPVGVMLAAPMGADALLLAVSAMLEAAAPWADRHPPMWSV